MRRFLLALLLVGLASPAVAQPSKCYSVPPPVSDYVNVRALAATVAETTTAPTVTGRNSDKQLVAVIAFTGTDFFLSTSGTAAIASADVTNGSASLHNPAVLVVPQGASVSVISPDTTPELTVAWYIRCN